MSIEQERLSRLYEDVERLAPLGGNAVHRRALAILANEINRQSGRILRRPCPDGPNGHRAPTGDEPFGFNRAYYEFRQDDRRFSVFLDPVEALASRLVDFYTGRLEVLEVRYSPETVSFADKSRELAAEYIRTHVPPVSVIPLAAENIA